MSDNSPRRTGDPAEINETKPFVRAASSTFVVQVDSSEQAEPVPGAEFGRYRIQQQLGRGGMGSVWLAHDTQLDRPVALKIPKLSDASGKSIERFLREARAVAALAHPNICPIFDIGQVDGTHFLAMGFIEGKPLSSYVSEARRHPERQVAQIIRKVALALHEAHGKGILHRDLKPANIMLDRRGEPIVTDFGLAVRLDREEESKLTQEGTIIGTPAYMSPEQIDGRTPVGPRSDIYSLGVVLYELLTGRCPFAGGVVSVIADVLHKSPRDVRELRTDVSPALAEMVTRAMAKKPDERFASMKDFAAALTAYLKGETAVDTQMVLAPMALTGVLSEPTRTSSAAVYEPLDHLAAPSLVLPALPQPQAEAPPYLWWVVGGVGGVVALLFVFMVGRSLLGGGANPARNLAVKTPTAAPAPTPPVSSPAAPPPVVLPPKVEANPPPEPAVVEVTQVETQPLEPMPPETEPAFPNLFSPSERPPNERPPSERPRNSDSPPGPPPEDGPGRFGDDHPLMREKGLIKIEERFKAADHNHDGKLDGGELPMHIIFRGDTNKDEALSLAELRAAITKLKDKLYVEPQPGERRPPRGPGDGPPGPGPGGPGGKGPRPPRP